MMQYYLILDGQYLVSKNILPNSTVVSKRPSTKHNWNGSEWVFNGYTEEETLVALRQQRNQLLSQTDWWVLPDRTATQAQLEYRQALRDLPANSSPELDANGQLINVNWPEKPE